MRVHAALIDETGAASGTSGNPVYTTSSAGSGQTNKEKILAANDLVKTFSWTDVGTANQRVAQISCYSATVGKTATATFAYTLDTGVYRLDTITWSVA